MEKHKVHVSLLRRNQHERFCTTRSQLILYWQPKWREKSDGILQSIKKRQLLVVWFVYLAAWIFTSTTVFGWMFVEHHGIWILLTRFILYLCLFWMFYQHKKQFKIYFLRPGTSHNLTVADGQQLYDESWGGKVNNEYRNVSAFYLKSVSIY